MSLLQSQHYGNEGFKGASIWPPVIPRDTSLSDRRCTFFSSLDFFSVSVKTKFCKLFGCLVGILDTHHFVLFN